MTPVYVSLAVIAATAFTVFCVALGVSGARADRAREQWVRDRLAGRRVGE